MFRLMILRDETAFQQMISWPKFILKISSNLFLFTKIHNMYKGAA
jgi:hypothetical protein